MSDLAREIRYALADARLLCEKLGLLAERAAWKKQAAGAIVRCPWHPEKNPSCSVRRASDGTVAVRCFSCGATGDALSLIAAVRGLSLTGDFRAVLAEAAALAGMAGLPEGPRKSAPRPVPEPERAYPDSREIADLLANCIPCTADPEVSKHLVARGLDPELAYLAGARAIPEGAVLPRFAAWQGLTWSQTGHRMVLPVRDVLGATRSLRAWRVREGDSPKRLPPAGYRATELVLACELGEAMLRGTYEPDALMVVEGEPDFLVAATRSWGRPMARLGIGSGSWTPRFAQRVPVGCEVFVWTHRDRAGDAYADAVIASLRPRGCRTNRWAAEAADAG